MTERQIPRELTNKPNPPRLEDKGDIFMAEGGQDASKEPQEQAKPTMPPLPDIEPSEQVAAVQKPVETEAELEVRKEELRKELSGLSKGKRRTILGRYKDIPFSEDEIKEIVEERIKPEGEVEKITEEERKRAEELKKKYEEEELGFVDTGKINLLQAKLTSGVFEGVVPKLKAATKTGDVARIFIEVEQGISEYQQFLNQRENELDKEQQEANKISDRDKIKEIGEEKIKILEARKKIEKEFREIASYVSELLPDPRIISPEEITKITEIQEEPQSPKRSRKIKLLMDKYEPENNPLPDIFLELIASDRRATDEFLHRVAFSPLEEERYQIRGFYSNTNYEKFFKVATKILKKEELIKLTQFVEANSTMHNMNYIVRRDFNQFAQESQTVLPEYFTVLSQLPGVQKAWELYEEITSEFNAIFTEIRDRDLIEIDTQVQKQLEAEKDLITGIYGGKITNREIARALTYARNMFRVSGRPAELASKSQIRDKEDPALYESMPFKDTLQILDYFTFLRDRFMIGDKFGGTALAEEIDKQNKEKRSKAVHLEVVGGASVSQRERQTIVNARMGFTTWRLQRIAGHLMVFEDSNGKNTDVVRFFLEHQSRIAGFKKRSDDLDKVERGELKRSKMRVKGDTRDNLKKDARTFFDPLLENTSIGLGMLTAPSAIANMFPEFQELVWDKVAELDPLVTARLLSRLETNGKGPAVKSLEDIFIEMGWVDDAKQLEKIRDTETRPSLDDIVKMMKKNSEQIKKLEDDKVSEDVGSELYDLRQEQDRLRIIKNEKNEAIIQILQNKSWRKLQSKLRTAHSLRMRDEMERLQLVRDGKDVGIKERIAEIKVKKESGEITVGESKELEDLEYRLKIKTVEDFLHGELELEGNQGRDEKGEWIRDENGEIKDSGDWKVLRLIRENGKLISRDMANIRTPDAWFLDDIPFQKLEWKNLGHFMPRIISDLGNFKKGNDAIDEIEQGPFREGMTVPKVWEILEKGEDGVIGVIGGAAVDQFEPIIISMLNFWRAKHPDLYTAGGMHTLKEANSRAQEWNLGAVDLNERGMRDAIDKAVARKLSTTGKEGNHKKLVELFGAQWYILWKSDARDSAPGLLMAFLYNFFKKVVTGK